MINDESRGGVGGGSGGGGGVGGGGPPGPPGTFSIQVTAQEKEAIDRVRMAIVLNNNRVFEANSRVLGPNNRVFECSFVHNMSGPKVSFIWRFRGLVYCTVVKLDDYQFSVFVVLYS